jgi:hypothetical protein
MTRLLRHNPIRCALVILALVTLLCAPTQCQETEWLPTQGTHAWARFGPRAWKEVRIRSSAFDENEQLIRSSTTIARTRVTRVALRTVSLCVATTVEVAGQEFSAEPREFTRDLAPQVESSKIVGTDDIEIDGQKYPTQVIQLVTKSGTKRDTSSLYFSGNTVPQTLKRVTTSVDTQAPGLPISTTVLVTELDKKRDVLGEWKCSWSVTTVIKRGDQTVTIREVHCQDVPGELVSQITEERNEAGQLVSRKELQLVGYGQGRIRRLFRRAR